ncbi:glycosyltransferase [Campylobacter suis]|uniref:Glycosyltransferase 2-like domain-containing protein n=1 Tax=Campylobacter suis TaxID=2790657 RepID=A0ABM8Q4X8_9BACT|nr:glycosyltransferase [Campylobacter suis]CAD7287951.1 hypothetical protein LMG8286_01027 [Campylobacter suis]
MKASLIIPTYKDPVALRLILDALQKQTYKNFEVIVAEDCQDIQTLKMLQTYKANFNIKHYSHEDIKNHKPKAVNNAILMSDGEYLIFIDGDTIPFRTFIEFHILLAKPGTVLCGRRVNLDADISSKIRNSKLLSSELEENYIKMYQLLKRSGTRHFEQGLSFHPGSFIYKIISLFGKNLNIVASNFSCFKHDILKVNGIDEALPFAPGRDDTDLQWRLEYIGIKMRSCKYCANLFHLDHSRNEREHEYKANMVLIKEKQNKGEFWAKDGVIKSS